MSPNEIESDLKNAKVLMVDDTPANIDVLRKVLIREGYQLFFAHSGEKAIKIASRALPDLILLDVMMPNMDGFETSRCLKRNEATQDIPIIFITAKNQPEDIIEGFKLGAVDYVNKPFRQEEVCMRVRHHLQTGVLMKQREHLIKDLRHSEERFRLLAHASPVGICQADIKGKIVYTNQKWQNILNLDEGNNWLQVIHAEDREEVERLWALSVHNLNECTLKFRITSQSETRWVQAHAIPLRYEESEIEGFVGTLEDITDFKRAEEQMLTAKNISEQARIAAEAANHAKSAFIANVSHELRTPLNGILGFTQLFKQDKNLNAEQQDGVEVIHRCGEYLLTLISDILDLSKIEVGRIELYPADFNLESFMSSIIDLFKMRTEQKGIAFNVQKNTPLPYVVHGDEKRLRQIIINLLSNATKFTKEGSVTLIVHYEENKLHFQVSDTGIGIATDEVDKIFDPFQQVGDPRYKPEGTGLGLSLTKTLVELMGGEIQVDSVLGQATTFSIVLDLPESMNQ